MFFTLLESRRIEDWDYDFLKNIVDVKLKEWTNLEYKKDFPPTDSEKNKLEHTICAFANTRGGYILIGIEANTINNVPIAISGIDDAKGLDEKITSFCGRITPRITPRFQKIPIPQINKIIFVIYVPESNEAHMASDNKYYVRINAQSLPADHYVVQKLFKKEYEIKERMREIIESKKQIFKTRGTLYLISFPYGFKENLIPIFDEVSGKLKKDTVEFLQQKQPILHGLICSKPTQFSFLQYSESKDGDVYAFVEVSHNGLIEIAERMDIEKEIWLRWITDYLQKTLTFVSEVYTFSKHDGTIRFVLGITDIKGKKLRVSEFQRDRYEYNENDLVIQRDATLSDIRNNLKAIIESVAAELMRSFSVNIMS